MAPGDVSMFSALPGSTVETTDASVMEAFAEFLFSTWR